MSPILLTHVLAASVSVALGAWQLLATKRTVRHRLVGYMWMSAMAITALSSFFLRGHLGIEALGGYSLIHGLSLWVLFSIVMAIRSAMHHRIAAHRKWVTGSYVGLVIAGVAAMAVPGRVLHTVVVSMLPSQLL